MRGRPPKIKTETLLDAARDAFLEAGHGATTAQIAARAGVSEGILFYRYETKDALLAAVIHREVQPPDALRNVAKLAGQWTVPENLEHVLRQVLASVARAHPFIELAMTSPRSGEIHRALFAQPGKPPPEVVVELIAGYLRAEMHLGRMRDCDPLPIARALFGGCIEQTRAQRPSGAAPDERAFVRGLVDVVCHGVVAPPPTPSPPSSPRPKAPRR